MRFNYKPDFGSHRVHDEMCSSAASVGVRSGQPRQISGTPYMERWRFRKNFKKIAMEAAFLNLWASTGVTTPGPLPAEASHVGKRGKLDRRAIGSASSEGEAPAAP